MKNHEIAGLELKLGCCHLIVCAHDVYFWFRLNLL